MCKSPFWGVSTIAVRWLLRTAPPTSSCAQPGPECQRRNILTAFSPVLRSGLDPSHWRECGKHSTAASKSLGCCPAFPMSSYSANYLLLLSRAECSSYAVFSMQDLDAIHVYQTHKLIKAQLIRPRRAYCLAGHINGTDRRNLAIDPVRPDNKFAACSPITIPVDGAGEWPIG